MMFELCTETWQATHQGVKTYNRRELLIEQRAVLGLEPLPEDELSKITWTVIIIQKLYVKHLFENINLLDWKIKASEDVSEYMVDIEVETVEKLKKVESGIKRTRIVRLIKEEAAYMPSHRGKWGVNPLSALRIKQL